MMNLEETWDKIIELDEYIFKLLYRLTQKYKITELFKHKEYEIIEKVK